ncbi:MAG TPA: hypothetical protein VEA69_22345, partial [Tepidisphaeraceae bacterium]|nr:hypothetical protein [Tepidisphaeraceae bacterium]
MRLQAACMTAQMPQGRAVYEGDPAAAAALMAAWPGEYRLGPEGAARTDARWTAFWATAGGTAAPWGGSPGSATTFCHERYTPAGRRRLVVVEGLLSAAVVEPAGWAGGRPRVVWEGVADRDWADRPALAVIANLPGPYTIRGGIPDPAGSTTAADNNPSTTTSRRRPAGV